MMKINKNLYIKKYNLNKIIEQRFYIITGFIVIVFSVIMVKLVILQTTNTEVHLNRLTTINLKLVESPSVPRGRIYDRNYNLLVDNIGYKTIYYQKPKRINKDEEIELAYMIAEAIETPYHKLKIKDLKEFWLLRNNQAGKKKITDDEYEQLDKRKLTVHDIHDLKLERITDDELASFTELDREAAYIYYLMNKGYYHDRKVIKEEDVSEKEYAYIAENANIYKGFSTDLRWERQYLYDDTLRSILGNVSSPNQGIPYELKDYYLDKDYALNDRVGISYLEYQYEHLLKGKKEIYQVNHNNNLELVEAGIRGHDIVLSIDIDLQLAVEQIMEEEMIKAKNTPNTDYYNKSFVLISDPNTGEILAYAAKQIVDTNNGYKIYDYTPFIATSSIALGSVIKGASMTVGYNMEAIEIGTRMLDECIKLKNNPPKCSWQRNLGVLDDIGALKMSSNSYQFKIALNINGDNYQYNKPITSNDNVFNIYRDTFAQFGLGIKTEIDLPNETTGYKGTKNDIGLLLNFAIGQYDNYTPLQLIQYINTIANGGERLQLQLLKQVHEPTIKQQIGPSIYSIEPTILNKIEIKEEHLKRIQKGFIEVMNGPLGRGYMGSVPNPAGKTGTSESFLDSTGDGKIDKETITKAFAGYFPADNPVMAIAVISPDVSHRYSNSNFTSNVNKHITSRICDKFFELSS